MKDIFDELREENWHCFRCQQPLTFRCGVDAGIIVVSCKCLRIVFEEHEIENRGLLQNERWGRKK